MSDIRQLGPVLIAWDDVGETETRSRAGDRLLADLIRRVAPGADERVARRCARCGGHDHGAPRALAAPVAVALAYAGATIVAAAAHARDAASLGVDVERGAAGSVLDDLAPLFAPLPPPDLRGWTRIEAVLKTDGRGLRVPPGELAVSSVAVDRLPGSALARVPGRPDAIEVADGPAPEGCVVSVALALPRRGATG
ncbi:hypothetical protein B5M43_008610 [Microbacterium sp. MEC084]|uniref:hypothetical protein n=1 Tax=Microbacterium sp. MEC084 TaxID=1963027 RepID=UPI00106F80F8|nr:hypothetical protein [Microbacterium sp. MEC084]MCD1268902.1 hypothetical protein [Microbacterium sp. MEC084]